MAYGFTIQFFTRMATKEPLSARPWSYLTLGLVCGGVYSYWDWWRRTATEEIMYGEDVMRNHNTIKAINNVRVGEEDET